MKLGIGAAQFGMDYGLANRAGQVPVEEIGGILDAAKRANITMLDTAMAYGNSEAALGKWDLTGFDIVTKLGAIGDEVGSTSNWVREQIEGSLNRLNVRSLYGVLLHQPAMLLSVHGRLIYNALADLKAEGLLENIGVSIYSPNELDQLIPEFNFDIVQAPMNIFDRRLSSSGWLTKLKKLNVEVHVRSIFLQGLLLMNSSDRPDYFKPFSTLFNRYDNWLIESHISGLDACLAFIQGLEPIDRIIVGIDSREHIIEIIKLMNNNSIEIPPDLLSNNESLICPSKWRL